MSHDVASQLTLHRGWDLYVKKNTDKWEEEYFKYIYCIKTVGDLWGLINNIPFDKWAGKINVFLMAGKFPLYEKDKIFWHEGGCWSTIVRGPHWRDALISIFLDVVGENVFAETINGIAILSVNLHHCIVKLWSTKFCETEGYTLKQCLEKSCTARFKSFS